MASVSNDPDGRRLQFILQGKRRTVRLGKVTAREAEAVRSRVERLIAGIHANLSMDGETSAWLAGIGDELAGKLAAVGLIPARPKAASATLSGYVAGYQDARADVEAGTRANYGIVGARLVAFFGDKALDAVRDADADRWLFWLRRRYAGPTVAKSVKIARQLWSQAVRDGVAAVNPFARLKTPGEVNTARAFFIGRATFAAVLDACPDDEWRLLLALARFGGLRTPSEPLSLEWSGVRADRFRVVAPKTEHQDGGERWVPLFPELRPHLEAAKSRAAKGARHVVTRWRKVESNLRSVLLDIIEHAGIEPWPRLYQNLRASRETELMEAFPIQVVAHWLGNSPRTALAHYAQTTAEHYRQAAQIPAQSPPVSGRQEPSAAARTAGNGRNVSAGEGMMTLTGFDVGGVTVCSGTELRILPFPSGAESGALARLVALWPFLPESVRSAVLALAERQNAA